MVAGWDAAAVAFLVSVWHIIVRADGSDTERWATEEDDTRAVGNALLVTVCMASLFGVGSALSLAGERTGAPRLGLIAVAVATIALSWTMLNTIYTLQYADLYYRSGAGGIEFGEGDSATRPMYRDFAYVAFTVGMTYQVSNTALRNRQTRRAVLAHAIFAYVFGVFIVAGAINLIAGLVR